MDAAAGIDICRMAQQLLEVGYLLIIQRLLEIDILHVHSGQAVGLIHQKLWMHLDEFSERVNHISHPHIQFVVGVLVDLYTAH